MTENAGELNTSTPAPRPGSTNSMLSLCLRGRSATGEAGGKNGGSAAASSSTHALYPKIVRAGIFWDTGMFGVMRSVLLVIIGVLIGAALAPMIEAAFRAFGG